MCMLPGCTFIAMSDCRLHADFQRFFQYLENQADRHLRGISEVKKAAMENKFLVLVQWEGRDDAESTWESAYSILEDMPFDCLI